jgi:hypothetical protein
MRKIIEHGEGQSIGHARIRGPSTEDTVTSRKDWPAIPLDWEVKAPCQQCNWGWMNDLEKEVRPTLIPMLENKAGALTTTQQESLAKWATLKVLMGQHGHPKDLHTIPTEAYHRFYRTRALPVGAQIWTGRYDGSGSWPTHYRHVEMFFSATGRPEPARANGYVVAFAVGYVAFLYFGHEIEDGPILDIGRDLGRYFVPVWPTTPVDLLWPPHGLLGSDGLDATLRGLPFGIA